MISRLELNFGMPSFCAATIPAGASGARAISRARAFAW